MLDLSDTQTAARSNLAIKLQQHKLDKRRSGTRYVTNR
jgi:hypothetical protein